MNELMLVFLVGAWAGIAIEKWLNRREEESWERLKARLHGR